MAVQIEWPWMKGKLDLWCCLIRFKISCKYYDFHLKSYRNMNIIRLFQYKYIRNQTGMAVKRSRSTQIHHLCKLGRAHIPNVTYQVPRPLVFWFQRRRFLKGFLPYMGMAAILVMWPLIFVINLLLSTYGDSTWNLSSNGQVVSEKTV